MGCCAYIRDYFRQTIGERAEVLGPAPLPVVRMNNRYRYRVTLYCNQSKAVRRAAGNRCCRRRRRGPPWH